MKNKLNFMYFNMIYFSTCKSTENNIYSIGRIEFYSETEEFFNETRNCRIAECRKKYTV